MARLPRSAIPLKIKCHVALRQLGCSADVIEEAMEEKRRGFGSFLKSLLPRVAELLECEVADLRLDHNPALGLRQKIWGLDKFGEPCIVGYIPHEHSPDDLEYRSAHAHHIKTNVAGDGAQFSDTVLMKRERRRQKRFNAEAAKRLPTLWTKPPKPTTRAKKSTWPKGQKIKSRGFERRKP
jgi:hypothetical protein